jgi:hypothetical protein
VGASGAGTSRLLDELAALVAAQHGTPPPLRVAPVEAGAAKAEPLRRALQPWYASAPDVHLAASLAAILPAVGQGAESLLAWLGAGPLAAPALVPPSSVLHATLAALTQGGIVLADDWEALDALTRSVLAELAAKSGTSVVAGRVDPSGPSASLGPCWPLEPLTERQVALLLRRWLKSPVVARRMAPDLTRWSKGRPGRVVALVRALRRDGTLVVASDGLRLATWPVPEPVLLPDPLEAFKRLKAEGPSAWRVVEAAAVATEPLAPELLAEAAGVKRALVDRVLAETAASRSGLAAGCVFGDPALKASVRARLAPARRAQAVERLVNAHGRLALESLRGLGPLLARLEAEADGGTSTELERTLAHVLARITTRVVEVPAVADLLSRALHRVLTLTLTPDLPLVLGVARLLSEAGLDGAVESVLRAVAPRSGGAEERAWLALRVRHGSPEERRAACEALAARADALSGVEGYAAWRALVEVEDADPALARRAWSETLDRLPTCDVAERIALHAARARSCEHARMDRAACAHLRRAAVLLGAVGRTAESARTMMRLGALERRLGRHDLGAAAYEGAARAFAALGDPARESEALAGEAEAALDRAHYDEAAALLDRACGLSALAEHGAPLSGLHLLLARAHRGRGDLAAERRHAAEALRTAEDDCARRLALVAGFVAELRLGTPGAGVALERGIEALEAAGDLDAAREARDTLADETLRGGDVAAAARCARLEADDPVARLQRARVLKLTGEARRAAALLEALGSDPAVPVDLRAEAFARLAEHEAAEDRPGDAARLAHAASALLEVRHRSRREDPRVHRMLSRVFRDVGERATAIRHRLEARRTLRLPRPAPGAPREQRRWARMLWRDDPVPAAPWRDASAG